MCLNYSGLDRWDAMLKMTGIELELISEIDMHLFIEKGMGDGISYIAKKHSKANNKDMECMIVVKKVYTLLILMQIIYMVGQ